MRMSPFPSRPMQTAVPQPLPPAEHALPRRAIASLDTPLPTWQELLPPRERAWLGGPWQESSFDLRQGLEVAELDHWPADAHFPPRPTV